MAIYRNFFKRVTDILLSAFLLILTLPITLPLLIILLIDFKGSPLFKQERVGYKNQIFKILKFRKFRDVEDDISNNIPDSERITALGKFMQRLSLDELPQLVNILIGEMSFIGPRPLLAFYLPYYTPLELHRHDVRPGLTGWAQIHGRASLQWDIRFEYDLFYVDHLDAKIDLRILYLTARSFIFPTQRSVRIPRLIHFRAYIRMPWHNDDEHELRKLFAKGHTKFALENFDSLEDTIFSRKVTNTLVLIDDYQHRYNSFVLVTIQGSSASISDYFIGNNSYLPREQMIEKYLNLIEKYLYDLGFTSVEKIDGTIE